VTSTTGTATFTCPTGSTCLGITPNAPACVATCANDGDCRSGFACKPVPDAKGAQVDVCWPISGTHAAGDECTGPEDCAGAASCLTNFTGGYCAVLYCTADAGCPADTHCVDVNGTASCLKACKAAADCTTSGLSRSCLSVTSADPAVGGQVQVCGSATQGVGIGQRCQNDSECTTFDCSLSYTGTCSATVSRGCKADSDCPMGEVCVESTAATAGYCTQACTAACTGAYFCIYSDTLTQGECLPGCSGPGDAACVGAAGLACTFGDVKGVSGGHYACARVRAGAAGANCSAATDCASGTCLKGTGTAGYCQAACGFGGFCTFPTLCSAVGGQNVCLLLCLGTDDCPAGMACTVPAGAQTNVCYPQ
jgi:hypothetical protein